MEIKMARGDLERRNIILKDSSGSTYQTTPDEIYFTVKKNANDHDFLFQKKLSDGTISLVETWKYQFSINPEDTDNLNFGSYDFDIEVVKDGEVKKTFCGTLTLAKEVTHHYNE